MKVFSTADRLTNEGSCTRVFSTVVVVVDSKSSEIAVIGFLASRARITVAGVIDGVRFLVEDTVCWLSSFTLLDADSRSRDAFGSRGEGPPVVRVGKGLRRGAMCSSDRP
jgi:hypothetical protein